MPILLLAETMQISFVHLAVRSEKKGSWDLGMQRLRKGQGWRCLYAEVSAPSFLYINLPNIILYIKLLNNLYFPPRF